MATFNPNVRVNLQTLVYIAKYYGQENIEKAIADKYFGSVSLEQAQKTFFQLPDFQAPELRSLEFNEGWNEQTFRHLIEHFKTIRTDKGLLVDLVNQAVHDNDTKLLEGLTRVEAREPTPANPVNVREATPPHEKIHPPQTTHATTETSHEDTQEDEADQPSDEPHESERSEEEESQERSAREEAVQNQRGQNRAYQTNQRQNPNQRQNYRNPSKTSPPEQKTVEKPAEGESAKDKVRRQRGQNRPSRRPLPLTPKPTPPASGGLLNNYLNFRDFAKAGQWAADRLGLKGVSNAIEKLFAPERWLGRAAQAGARLAGQAAQAALNGLTKLAADIGGRLIGQAAGAVGRSIVTSAASAIAGIGLPAILITLAVIGAILYAVFALDSFSQCGQPGTVTAAKSTKNNKEIYSEGENIEYVIIVTYNIKCPNAYADIEVKDNIPTNTTFVEGSAKGAVAQSISLPGIFSGTIPFFAPDGVLDGNTLTWRLTKIGPNSPSVLVFSVTPAQNDVWISNQATISYKTYNMNWLGLGSSSTGGGPVPPGGGEPPNQDTCGGTYKNLTNPVGNFGDPSCNFDKDVLYNQLKETDPANADFWFYKVVRCESTYNPNTWRDPNLLPKTPDPAGAWGLYQMGRGRNGQFDHGDVAWQLQTTNAVAYSKGISSIGAYWACAR